jgi:hypothetical protein
MSATTPMPEMAMMMIDYSMKRNPFHILLIFILPVIALQSADGQQNDFQCWPSIQMNLEVIKNLKVQIEEEVRLQENCSQFGKQINDIGLSYRINKYLRTALYYRIEADWKNADDFVWRNGAYADVAFRYEPGRFTLGYRLRVQSSRIEMGNKEEQLFSRIRNRHKFTVEYDIKGIPIAPFAEGELFIDFGGPDGYSLSSYRAWAGVSYAINKQNELSLKYGIDQELNTPDPLRAFVIAVSYSVDLKLPSVK